MSNITQEELDLIAIYRICVSKQVSFSLDYIDGPNEFNLSISSTAAGENKDFNHDYVSLSMLLEDVEEHFNIEKEQELP